MAQEPIKRQLNNAIKTLANQFPKPLYNAIKITDASCPFHLEVFRNDESKGDEIFKIRVTLGKISKEDIRLCQSYKLPAPIFTKLIACKKSGYGQFEYHTIEKAVNSKSPPF